MHLRRCYVSVEIFAKISDELSGAEILGLGVVTPPLKTCRRRQSMFDPLKCHILSFKNCSGITAIFTSSRMKDFCQKWKVKLIFRGAPETVWWLDLTDPDHAYFTTDLYATVNCCRCGSWGPRRGHRGWSSRLERSPRRRRDARPSNSWARWQENISEPSPSKSSYSFVRWTSLATA